MGVERGRLCPERNGLLALHQTSHTECASITGGGAMLGEAANAGLAVIGDCPQVTGICPNDYLTPLPVGATNVCPCTSCHVLAAQEAERKRVATELHDGLGQSLSVIRLRLEQAIGTLDPKLAGEAIAILQRILPNVKGALEDVRRIAMNLRPSILEDLGVLATLSWFLREYSSVYQSIAIAQAIEVREDDIPDAVKLPLFRIVQEAFNNVAKHSRATHVCLRLRKEGGMLHLRIDDDGVGFDPNEVAVRKGLLRTLGHAGMLDRVRMTDGNLAIDTAPSAGVRIAVVWPYPPAG